MTRRFTRSLAFAAPLLAAISLAAGAWAQTPSNLTQLHDALQLSPTQQNAWTNFSAASQSDGQQEARDRTAEAMLPTLTSPQRVDLSLAAMRADLQTAEQRGAAVKAFYATLTPGQRATFDRETAPQTQQAQSPQR
jgi:hypothetical protein